MGAQAHLFRRKAGAITGQYEEKKGNKRGSGAPIEKKEGNTLGRWTEHSATPLVEESGKRRNTRRGGALRI